MRKKQVDVLVIGSGMGGMSAAALLAKDGFKVMVAEKLPYIGGRCSTRDYKGYRCYTGVTGVETGGLVQNLFKELGAEFNIVSAGLPQYLIKDKTFTVPQKGGMKTLLEASGASQASIEKVMSALSRALNWKGPSPGISLFDWLQQYSKHKGILEVFQTLVNAALMVRIDDLSAHYFFKFIKTLSRVNEFGFCSKGSGDLPGALGQTVLKNGGEIWNGSEVKKILVENNAVQGVLIKSKDREFQIDSQAVISDIGPQRTVELVGKKQFDKDYLQEMETKLKPTSVISLQFGLDRPVFEQNHLFLTGAKRVNAVYQPTLLCPELAPKGKHLLVANAIPEQKEALLTEKGRKQEIDVCLEDLKKTFPEFEKSSTMLLAGINRDYWPGMHAWPGKDMPSKTPVINLYNVGDGVKQSGYSGLPAVVQTGIKTADEIKRRTGVFKGVISKASSL